MICATKPRIRYVQTLADYGVTPTGESPDDGPDDGPTGFSIFLDTEPDPRDAEAGRAAPAMLLTPGGVVRVPVGVDVGHFVTALARLDAAVPFIGLDAPQDTATTGHLGFRSLPDGSLALTDADGTTATIDRRPVILTLTDLETFANRSGPIAAAERYALTGKGPAADGDATGGDDPTLSAAVAGTATLAIPQMATSAIRFPIDSLLRGGLKLSGIGTFLTAFLDSTPLNQGEGALLATVADGDIVRDLIVHSAAGENGESEDDDEPPPSIPDNAASQPNPDGGEDPDDQDLEQNLRDSDARSQAEQFLEGPNGPVRVPTDEDVLQAARRPDQNGLTRSARPLQKHGVRPNTAWPELRNGPLPAKNRQGQQMVEQVLRSPNRFVRATTEGDIEIWDLNTGRGVRMVGNRMFSFLCPTRTIRAMMN